MCGIAGVLFHRDPSEGPRKDAPAPAFVERALRALAPRGPDGRGVFVEDGVALIHTRLALVDVANGQQPLSTPDGRYFLIVNGEVYDGGSLRAALEARGALFRTRSDSELLLWALALDGAQALAALEGEYAFCFWDRTERRALLGRDPLGVKPLVLAQQGGTVWFASEVKALLALLPERPPLALEGVVEALVAPALSGVSHTPFRGIHSLAAGHVLEVRAGGQRCVRDETFRFHDGATRADPAELREALRRATAERLQADVEVGAFFSGGVDSSALVAAGLTNAHPLKRCYTIRFDHHMGLTEPTHAAGSIVLGDDAPFVEELAQHWPIELTRVHASRPALLAEIDALGATQDRIAAWEQELSQRFLARAAARTLKAVLVGDAADETHFGYAFALTPEVSQSPRALLERFGFSARRGLLREPLRARAGDLDESYRALCADAGFPYGGGLSADRLATGTLLAQRWLPRLLHNGDIHTLAFGLEARVPFADRRVFSLAAQVSIDDAFTPFHGIPEKAFLRRALSPWLPAEIIARPKSALPRDDGMGTLYRAALRALLQDATACERLSCAFDVHALRALCQHAGEPDDVARACLFSVLAFESFLRHHVD